MAFPRLMLFALLGVAGVLGNAHSAYSGSGAADVLHRVDSRQGGRDPCTVLPHPTVVVRVATRSHDQAKSGLLQPTLIVTAHSQTTITSCEVSYLIEKGQEFSSLSVQIGFGDGETFYTSLDSTQSSKTIRHHYSSIGAFLATVSVTSSAHTATTQVPFMVFSELPRTLPPPTTATGRDTAPAPTGSAPSVTPTTATLR